MKIRPQQDSASEGQTIVVNLASNTIIDLDTLSLIFKVETTCTHSGETNFSRISANADGCMFNKVELLAGGIVIGNSFDNYHLIHKLLYSGTTSMDKHLARRLTQYSTPDNALPTTKNMDDQYFIADNFIGAVGTLECRCIDTSIFPDLQLRIQLAPASEVLHTAVDSPDSATYSLKDIYATVDTISISDGLYTQMLTSRLAEGNPIELPFKNYYTFTGSKSANSGGSFNMSCSSRSIDRIIVAPRTPVTTIKTQKDGSYCTGGAQRTWFDKAGITGYNFTLNNVSVPTYKVDNEIEHIAQARKIHGIDKDMSSGDMLTNYFASPLAMSNQLSSSASGGWKEASGTGDIQWRRYHWHAGVSLEHLGTEENARLTSGYDSTGGNSRIIFNFDATSDDDSSLLYNAAAELFGIVETTGIVKVFANRMIEISN